ncbi:MAG: DNA mismatch repair endonuclease MutL [Ruminococcaceae bacterium]|nr:DNA mismatch repair endonuclease MutL [Oscillospiraceae bacterium]
MSVINILSPHVADLIAAGEVVERPASVVKELVENAIDAGARNITVEIRSGGMHSIRVTDDGCGMSPEDAGIAFLRHATSKLRDERGLECIGTLGFRGEALAAISAVSHVELITRERGAETGTRVLLTAGEIDEMGPAGCPEGTSLCVRDLFYNTPARQKFMKSDRAEGQACVNAALRCALGHPEVSVRMRREGEEVFFTPGDGQAKSAVYALLGRDNAANLLECAGEGEGVGVRGFVSAPHAGRGNRAMQFFFLNGRAFRSATLQAAVEQAYKNTLLTGRFPACVLYLTLHPGKVDVNVHPTKSEVRFSEEKKVFDAVYSTVRAALEERDGPHTAEIRLSASTQRVAAAPRQDFFRQMTASEFREQPPAPKAAPAPAGVQTRLDLSPRPAAAPLILRDDGAAYGASHLVPRPEIPRVPAAPRPVETAPAAPAPAPPEETPEETPPWRVIGEALDTYILVETGETLLLIDKHACHERILFDALQAGLGPRMRQTLLAPLTWSPGAEDTELLEQNSALLAEAGFEIERFGEDGVIVRAVPADAQGSEIALLEELCDALRSGRPEDRRETLCHTIACKAAIKAGSRSDPAELEALAAKVISGEVRYCPHGRPVSVKLTKAELDRQFKRIV